MTNFDFLKKEKKFSAFADAAYFLQKNKAQASKVLKNLIY